MTLKDEDREIVALAISRRYRRESAQAVELRIRTSNAAREAYYMAFMGDPEKALHKTSDDLVRAHTNCVAHITEMEATIKSLQEELGHARNCYVLICAGLARAKDISSRRWWDYALANGLTADTIRATLLRAGVVADLPVVTGGAPPRSFCEHGSAELKKLDEMPLEEGLCYLRAVYGLDFSHLAEDEQKPTKET